MTRRFPTARHCHSPFAPSLQETEHMNIHEYQGKAVLKEFGAPVSAGFRR
jgi:hypothetical protein